MRLKLLIFSLFFSLFINKQVFAVAPSINSVSQPQGSFQKFAKIEWDLTVNKEYPNPYYFYDSSDTPQNNPTNMTWYGADGVSIDMVVKEPGATSEIKVPAFYYQDYKRVLIDGLQIIGKVGKPVWKVRFTPSKVGVYSYYFTIQDKEGIGRYPQSGTLSFTVSESNNDGFIRVSAKDPRFLAFDSGKPYIPIGAGSQWYPNRLNKSYSYEDLFNKFGENGVNLIRIWDEFDFALGIDGAQTVWSTATDPILAARGVEIKTNNVRSGLRSARPANGDPWYQRLAISEPNNNHRLVAWVKYSNLVGNGARIFVKKGISYNSGQILAQSQTFLGTQSSWQQITLDFVPQSETISLVLENNSNQGNFYVDDVSLGPLDNNNNNNNLKYDIVTDGGFERHFAKDNPGNDPNANRSLPREFGNYVNQHTAYELDKIIQSAEKNNVKIQLCSCSGPWFTWPQDPDMYNWNDVWVLKSWQRNFRYRVARWGYSPSILAWEKHNEHGHITPGSALFDFYKKYGQYQKTVDIYKHLRTTSQNSQAYSPQFWSTNEVDIANYHDYLDFRSATYTNLSNDEALFFQRFAWCLTDTRGPSSPYCNGLGLGDGTTWYGNPKPWIWGETGVYQNGKAIQGGTAGALFLHNIVWVGLFSPMGTTPLDWYQSEEDSTSTNAKFSSRKAASIFFSNINFDEGKMVFLRQLTTYLRVIRPMETKSHLPIPILELTL